MPADFLPALCSFLRVLAVAQASAWLALESSGEDITARGVGLAAASAFALTVVNYLRPGEPRFGVEDGGEL